MRYLHCVVKFQLRKLGCPGTKMPFHDCGIALRFKGIKKFMRLLRCASEIKKINLRILRCAFTSWKDCCALLRYAFAYNVICAHLCDFLFQISVCFCSVQKQNSSSKNNKQTLNDIQSWIRKKITHHHHHHIYLFTKWRHITRKNCNFL